MAFLVRTIAIGAAGREIVREHRHDGDSLTIGRGAESDVVIADLAALPRHAHLRRDGPGHLIVESAGDHPLTIDGRRRAARRVALDAGIAIEIGRHMLAIARDGGDVAVTITERPAHATDAARAFSLAGTLPGKRAMAWSAVIAILALFLAWPILSFGNARIDVPTGGQASERALSAGPLSRAHAALEGNCKACHAGAFVAVADAQCAACHTSVHGHADPARMAAAADRLVGLAALKRDVAVAFGRPAGRCVDCHQEHLGRQTVAAADDQLFCANCHGDLKARLPDTRLAAAADFATAHPQFAPTLVAVPGTHPRMTRISLDDRPREASGLKFPHALHLSAGGGVARMAQTLGRGTPACADCHVPDRDGVRFRPVSMEANCEGCHALGYDRVGGTVRRLRHGDVAAVIADLTVGAERGGGRALGERHRPGPAGMRRFGGGRSAAEAIRATFTQGGACFDCHTVSGGGTDWRVLPVRLTDRYLRHGWFDHAAHREQSCQSCHVGAPRSTMSSDVLIPGIATCRTCHAGEAAAAPQVASTCAMCHDYHRSPLAPRASRRERAPLRIAWSE